ELKSFPKIERELQEFKKFEKYLKDGVVDTGFAPKEIQDFLNGKKSKTFVHELQTLPEVEKNIEAFFKLYQSFEYIKKLQESKNFQDKMVAEYIVKFLCFNIDFENEVYALDFVQKVKAYQKRNHLKETGFFGDDETECFIKYQIKNFENHYS
ncbi:hypothetical protein KGV52_00960, partial [Candidatus Gracilibacteria bacterium]|nr:hypothetical protein [Candidatus Gracilibacteria bacterium]MBS9775263.1 hypothetical protein [Candidatus Gracilibacteria bacterium]